MVVGDGCGEAGVGGCASISRCAVRWCLGLMVVVVVMEAVWVGFVVVVLGDGSCVYGIYGSYGG